MSGLTRWTPRLVIAVGVLHLGYGVLATSSVLVDMASDGVVASADDTLRRYVVWFLAGGVALLVLGGLGNWAARTTGQLPGVFGWGLVAIGLVVSVPEPMSGGWLVLALGVCALVASRRSVPAAVER